MKKYIVLILLFKRNWLRVMRFVTSVVVFVLKPERDYRHITVNFHTQKKYLFVHLSVYLFTGNQLFLNGVVFCVLSQDKNPRKLSNFHTALSVSTNYSEIPKTLLIFSYLQKPCQTISLSEYFAYF